MTGCCASLTVRVYMQMEELMEKYANLRRAYCCQSFLIKKKKKKRHPRDPVGPVTQDPLI